MKARVNTKHCCESNQNWREKQVESSLVLAVRLFRNLSAPSGPGWHGDDEPARRVHAFDIVLVSAADLPILAHFLRIFSKMLTLSGGEQNEARMEKYLFKKVELWVTGLVVMAMLVAMFVFGVLVRDVAKGKSRLGFIGQAAYGVASLPSMAAHELSMLASGDLAGMSTDHSDRFEGQSGWTFHPARLTSGLDGYLLFSRHDGDAGHHVFELVDLTSGEIVHRIDLDSDKLFAGASRETVRADVDDWKPARFQAVHPLPLDNGDILVKGHRTPMVRMSPCGEPVWVQDEFVFHHTTEPDPDGTFWTSSWIETPRVEGLNERFLDPGIVQFSKDGEILHDQSLTETMLEQGLGYMIFGDERFYADPLHLNDVQPVPGDGPYWKKGDVFVSLRHISTIMQYRPSERRIVWFKQGPWSAQHDVDIIDETTIAVFNNNMLNLGSGAFVDGHSDVMFYNFETDEVTSPYGDLLAEHDFRTEAAGLFTLLPDGHLYVDEAESGRTLIFTPVGELAVEHVNRAENGLIYHLGWSRYLDREAGDRLLAQFSQATCQ